MDRIAEMLSEKGPGFQIPGDKVCILHHPSQFIKALETMSVCAEQRIVWSTLYLGTGPKEQNLCDLIAGNIQKNPSLEVLLLMDKNRALRAPKPNSDCQFSSAGLVAEKILTHSNPDKVVCALFQPPTPRGIESYLLQGRFKEIAGVQHMKYYIFDDKVILTGANLSDIYFEKRQDRYLIVESKELADHLHSLTKAVASLSHKLEKNGSLSFDKKIPHPDKYLNEFSECLRTSLEPFSQPNLVPSTTTEDNCVLIYPSIQIGSSGVFQDSSLITELLELSGKDEHLQLASGYFNLPRRYIALLRDSPSSVSIVAASSRASGFHQGAGLSGLVPSLYESILSDFCVSVSSNTSHRVKVMEYDREAWSFHQKGIWLSSSSSPLFVSVAGSSNFGYRSMFRDLECNFTFLTSNGPLKDAFVAERELSAAYLRPLTRPASAGSQTVAQSLGIVRGLSRLFRHYL